MGKSDLRVFITADTNNFNKNIKSALGSLIQFENVAKSVGSSIKTALVGAFAIDSATRFFSTMIESGRGFEDLMARVKAITNANTKQFKMMREEAARLGAFTRYSAKEAAAALENLTRNGLDARKATKALSSVLELAGANAIELADAADIVTNTMNMFGLKVDLLNRLNDVLSKTTASSATNLTELYEALKYCAPTANLFGIQLEEVNAALGVLANQGIKGSQAGTTLRNVLNSLVKPSAKAADILKNLGIDEVSIKMDGLLGTLQKLQGLDISDYVKIFGKEFGGYIANLANSGDLTSALKESLEGSTGEAARMFKEGAGSFNVAIDNFTSTFESAMIKAFDAVKPVLTNVVNGFTDFISALTDLPTVATAAFSIIGGKGVSEFKKIYDEISATNRAIQEKEELLNNVKGGFNFGDLIISYKESSFNELDLPSLIQQINESEQATSKLKKAFNSIDVKSLDNAYNAFAAINELLHRFDLDDLKVDLNDALLDEDRLNHYLDNLKRIPNILNEEIRNGNYFGLPTEEQARKKAAEYTKEIQRELSKVKPDAVKKVAAAFVLLNEEIENTPKQVKIVLGTLSKIGSSLKGLGSSIVNFFGGWFNIGITVAIAAITALVSGFRKMGEAVRESRKAMKEANSEVTRLNTTFKATVKELAELKKGSIAWETRFNWLKLNYPELTEQLRLHEVYLNSNSEAYKNLAASMDKVIERQGKVDLADAAVTQRDKLNKTYYENDFGWLAPDTRLKRMEEYLTDKYKTELDELNIKNYMQDIMSILAEPIKGETEQEKKEQETNKQLQISDIIKQMNIEFPKVKFNADAWAIEILNDYNKWVGNEIKQLDKYLNHETHSGVSLNDINTYVEQAGKLLEQEIANIKKDAETKYSDADQREDYIASETKSFANRLLDEIINKFRGVQIDGKDFRDILQANDIFKKIAAEATKTSSVVNPIPPTDIPTDSIADAKKEYADELDRLTKELDKGYITEKDFQQKKLSALSNLIAIYRRNGDVLDDTYKMYIEEQKTLSESLKEPVEGIDKSDYYNLLNEILNRKSDIDLFSDNSEFKEGRLNFLQSQLEDLKTLRDTLGEGFEAEIKQLDSAILVLSKHVEGLSEAFTTDRIEEFRKELNRMKFDVGLAAYDNFIGFNLAIVNIADSINTLKNLEGNDWEKFVSGFLAVVSITDSLVNTATSISGFIEMIRELTKQKEILNAVESGSKAADIAGIEAEAAAVVGAEATKTAAIESATVANVAAKMIQAEAALVLMAAESAAAYAGIPFAAVGLAAAQIGEMKALIAAAAALPAFADGGIVGGSSYTGDKILARVNSGEMILNQSQQRNLFSMLNNGVAGGQVEFKIKGRELVGVLNNYNNKYNKVK